MIPVDILLSCYKIIKIVYQLVLYVPVGMPVRSKKVLDTCNFWNSPYGEFYCTLSMLTSILYNH
jgi:hypothetical protein